VTASAEDRRGRRRWPLALAALAAVLVLPLAAVGLLAFTNPSPRTVDRWQALAPLPEARGEVASATRELPAGGGELFAVGGFTALAATSERVSVYSTEADRWEELPRLPAGRHHAGAAVLGDDLFVTGGAESATGRSPTSSHWRLRDGASSWENLEQMPEARWGHRMVALSKRLFVIGGGGSTSRVQIYSEADGWSTGAEMPSPRDHLAVVVREGEIWAIGGRDGDGPLAEVHIYSPERDRWREGPTLPEPISAAAEGVLDGDIHLVGGEDPALLGGGTIDRHLVLRRGADAWEALDGPPLPVHGAAGGAVDGELLVAGGASRQGPLSAISWTDYAARFR
jgi:N-acetylneuraminic acid mutarotase